MAFRTLETQLMDLVNRNYVLNHSFTVFFVDLDSPESVLKEIGVFFPEFDIDNWYKKEEESFRNNNVTFAKEKFVHLLNEQ